MKDEIEQIVGKVESGHLEPKEAVDELLVLFGVSQQRELLLDFLKWQSIAYSCNNDEIGNAKEVEAFFKSNNCG